MGMGMTELIRVVIADDHDDARNYLARVLNFEDNIEIVGQAENGQIAVEMVEQHHPHVVLMDMNMPIMDGVTACEHMKRIAPATQIILISSQDDPEPMKKAIENGAAAFLIKPVGPDDLIDLVQRAHTAYKKILPA